MFDIEVIRGDGERALAEPNPIMITESMAKKYFGTQDPIGKTLDIPQNDNDLLVRGVCRNIPENTHFDHRLYQFYESRNGQIGQQSQRSRNKKNARLGANRHHYAIFRRCYIDHLPGRPYRISSALHFDSIFYCKFSEYSGGWH